MLENDVIYVGGLPDTLDRANLGDSQLTDGEAVTTSGNFQGTISYLSYAVDSCNNGSPVVISDLWDTADTTPTGYACGA